MKVSPKTVERVLHDVGEEITQLRDKPPSRLSRTLVPKVPADAPKAVAVSCDGGRMMTRQPGHGRGVHQQAWRETKNANFERLEHKTFDEDPHPELPECFGDPAHVAKLAESAVLEVTPESLEELHAFQETQHKAGDGADASEAGGAASASLEEGVTQETVEEAGVTEAAPAWNPDGLDENRLLQEPGPETPDDRWQPRRLFRTCLSSLACAATFGLAMAREATRRRFDEALAKAFVADGLSWNWSIWRKHFRDFTPILDFVHVVEYLYQAAKAACRDDAASWSLYLRWCRWCWQSRANDVLSEMAELLRAAQIDPDGKVQQGPFSALHTAYRYLNNNVSRMDYVSYRKAGLPVTSAAMESLVKQIHQRVKGTEMYWNDCQRGGEGIVQLRSSYLCDDDRLRHYLRRRPGHPYVRRTTQPAPSTTVC